MAEPRVRRRPDQAKALILGAAEDLLVEAGPGAVGVRAVGERVGMTDAGVAHHFGNREGLWVALLHHGGRRIRGAVSEAVDAWAEDRADLGSLIKSIARVYEDGYGALAVSLHAAGWSDPGAGFLEPVVDILHAAREKAGGAAPRSDTRLAVAALHQALALEPVYGDGFRRSAGMSGDEAGTSEMQLRWWSDVLQEHLGLTPRA